MPRPDQRIRRQRWLDSVTGRDPDEDVFLS
jgi:hypothetical protein